MSNPSFSAATSANVPVSQGQITQLKAQIAAYKHIARNEPVPPQVIADAIHQVRLARDCNYKIEKRAWLISFVRFSSMHQLQDGKFS